jgi:uncharacterized protein YjbI with pentapeptide repeats
MANPWYQDGYPRFAVRVSSVESKIAIDRQIVARQPPPSRRRPELGVGLAVMAMTGFDLCSRGAAIEALLLLARHELLVLVVASSAADDDAAAIASARLRWAIASARQLIMAVHDARAASPTDHARHAHQLDRIANRAQRWLVAEPPRPLHEIGGLVDRRSARPGRWLPAVDADRAALVELDLDELELTRISLRAAQLDQVSLRRATCTAADASASRWQRCRLERAALGMAVFVDAQLRSCDLSRANLSGTSWHRAVVARCTLRRAALTDARLDRAVFSDCDLRGADLGIVRSANVATLVGARFVRCDLRDTHWRGRELGGATLVDCRLYGARGGPRLAGVVIERPDLSRLGDGSRIASQSDAIADWSPA